MTDRPTDRPGRRKVTFPLIDLNEMIIFSATCALASPNDENENNPQNILITINMI